MDQSVLEALRKHSKNDASFEALKEKFESLDNRRRKAEQRLQLLESVIRDDYDGILITELSLDKPGPRIVYVNEGFEQITGYRREEVIGETPRLLQGPKTDRRTLDRMREKLSSGQSFFGRLINYRKDGSEFVNQIDVHPLKNSEGEVTHWVSYLHDITERKRAERNVVDTEIEFDELKEESKRTLVDVDVDGNILTANRAFRDLIGYDLEELQKKKVWELMSDKFTSSLRDRFEEEQTQQNFDEGAYRVILEHKSGAPIQVKVHTRLLDLKERRIIRADVKNITLQKRVLNNLQRKQEDYSGLFHKVSDFTYRLIRDEEGKYHFETLSENFPELTGYYGDKFITHGSWSELIHPEDREQAVRHLETVFNGSSHTEVYRIARSDGSYIKVLDYAQPLHEEGDSKTVTAVRGAVSTHLEEPESDASQ